MAAYGEIKGDIYPDGC